MFVCVCVCVCVFVCMCVVCFSEIMCWSKFNLLSNLTLRYFVELDGLIEIVVYYQVSYI